MLEAKAQIELFLIGQIKAILPCICKEHILERVAILQGMASFTARVSLSLCF